MIRRLLQTAFWGLTALVMFTTLAPMTDSQEWWVRGWDFPRIHIAVVSLSTVLLGLFVLNKPIVFAIVLLAAAASYQAYRIYPYTKLVAEEIPFQSNVPAQEQVSLMALNVLMQNTDHAAVADIIAREEPNVLLLMETDQTWVDALAPALKRYDTVIPYPLDNHYGLVFATNLGVSSAEIVQITDDETPTVLAQLDGPTGSFFFVGLHPRPPVPGQDTDERDAQIRHAALLADRKIAPVVAMGDFNDVAWSRTSERFKEYGDFRDPRIGRGILPSYDATSILMQFPIDHLYLTEGLGLVSFSMLGPVGSDHFPVKAVITVQ